MPFDLDLSIRQNDAPIQLLPTSPSPVRITTLQAFTPTRLTEQFLDAADDTIYDAEVDEEDLFGPCSPQRQCRTPSPLMDDSTRYLAAVLGDLPQDQNVIHASLSVPQEAPYNKTERKRPRPPTPPPFVNECIGMPSSERFVPPLVGQSGNRLLSERRHAGLFSEDGGLRGWYQKYLPHVPLPAPLARQSVN